MTVNDVLNSLKFDFNQKMYNYDGIPDNKIVYNIVDSELNHYLNHKDNTLYAYTNLPIKEMSNTMICDEMSKMNIKSPYYIAWDIIFNDVLLRRRLDKLNTISNRMGSSENTQTIERLRKKLLEKEVKDTFFIKVKKFFKVK